MCWDLIQVHQCPCKNLVGRQRPASHREGGLQPTRLGSGLQCDRIVGHQRATRGSTEQGVTIISRAIIHRSNSWFREVLVQQVPDQQPRTYLRLLPSLIQLHKGTNVLTLFSEFLTNLSELTTGRRSGVSLAVGLLDNFASTLNPVAIQKANAS